MAVRSPRHHAYDHIRSKLRSGRLTFGSHLSEQTLAKEMGTSRTPIREALSRLSAEGLVEQIPERGSFIKRFSRQELWELLELRKVLEGYAAGRAALRVGPEQLEQLGILCDRMLQVCRKLHEEKRRTFTPEENARLSSADASFHMVLMRASGNARVERLVEDYGLITNLCRRTWPAPESLHYKMACWTWRSHARILRAVKRNDSDGAMRLMSRHIHQSEVAIMGHFSDEWDEPVATPMAGLAMVDGEIRL